LASGIAGWQITSTIAAQSHLRRLSVNQISLEGRFGKNRKMPPLQEVWLIRQRVFA
jgi:hypothetical protein